MKKKYFLIALGACVAAVLLFLYFKGSKKEEVSYLTQAARIGDITQAVNAAGAVGALRMVTVGAQASGQIKKLHVSLGQEVREGELIVEIDSTTQLNDLRTNEAQLDTYKARLAAKQVALKIAQTRYAREKRLKARNAASSESLEEAENTLALARAELREVESLVEQTQRAVNTAEVNLGYTRISSPLTGTVVSVQVEEGQTVNAAQTTPTLVQIADLTRMEINIEISEGDITKVKPGMSVTYTVLSEPDILFTTTLASIDPGLTTLTSGKDAESKDSDTAVYYYGKLIEPNEDGLLRIGMTTQNVITISSARDALVVPTLALRSRGDKKIVLVPRSGGRIEERDVVTGLADIMNTQILSGLSEGEEVVLSSMTEEEIRSSLQNAGHPGPGR